MTNRQNPNIVIAQSIAETYADEAVGVTECESAVFNALEAKDQFVDGTLLANAELGLSNVELRRRIGQFCEVSGLSPIKYPNGRRLPDAELEQDPAFLALKLGSLEAGEFQMPGPCGFCTFKQQEFIDNGTTLACEKCGIKFVFGMTILPAESGREAT